MQQAPRFGVFPRRDLDVRWHGCFVDVFHSTVACIRFVRVPCDPSTRPASPGTCGGGLAPPKLSGELTDGWDGGWTTATTRAIASTSRSVDGMASVSAVATRVGKTLVFSREFTDLVRAIGECKSKQEEDGIVEREAANLKAKLAQPKLDKSKIKEYIVRLMYVEMLGHDASFGYVFAVKATHENNLMAKKVREHKNTSNHPTNTKKTKEAKT